MFTGFLSLSGNEVINNARAAAYATNLGITSLNCGDCSGLAAALWDDPYTSPDMDDAPWWDPSVADSKDYAGLVGLDITGLGKSTGYHNLVSLSTDGAALHPLRRSHREIQIRALSLARTEGGLSYGLSWLASVLRGGVCSPGCAGDTLCFLTACPPCPPGADSDTCASPYLRTLFNCGLLSMDEPTDVKRIGGGYMATVTFTIAAGDPHIYRDPTLIAAATQPGAQLIANYNPAISTICDTDDISCLVTQRPTSPVTEWPVCTAPPAPILPPIPIDGCFPVGKFTAARHVFALPAGQVPVWAEKVPYIVIRAGGSRMERIILRWYGNPTEKDCAAALDPCAACAEINVAFIPKGSTLTIDGRSETATVDCPGGPNLATASPQIYGPGGTPFMWPVFNCADSLCLELIAKYGTIAADASVEVYYAIRQDAA